MSYFVLFLCFAECKLLVLFILIVRKWVKHVFIIVWCLWYNALLCNSYAWAVGVNKKDITVLVFVNVPDFQPPNARTSWDWSTCTDFGFRSKILIWLLWILRCISAGNKSKHFDLCVDCSLDSNFLVQCWKLSFTKFGQSVNFQRMDIALEWIAIHENHYLQIALM